MQLLLTKRVCALVAILLFGTSAVIACSSPASTSPPAELTTSDSYLPPSVTEDPLTSEAGAAQSSESAALASASASAVAQASKAAASRAAASRAAASRAAASRAAASRAAAARAAAARSATHTSSAAANCTPGYSPCIPDLGTDVDCAGGSGNGPRYVQGPVYVTGPDIYGLDADGNGIGCQS